MENWSNTEMLQFFGHVFLAMVNLLLILLFCIALMEWIDKYWRKK